jgi:hypothetical protein
LFTYPLDNDVQKDIPFGKISQQNNNKHSRLENLLPCCVMTGRASKFVKAARDMAPRTACFLHRKIQANKKTAPGFHNVSKIIWTITDKK